MARAFLLEKTEACLIDHSLVCYRTICIVYPCAAQDITAKRIHLHVWMGARWKDLYCTEGKPDFFKFLHQYLLFFEGG